MGLEPIMMTWFETIKTKEQELEDGFTIHAGMAETSSMLYIIPNLVDSNYENATSFTGTNMEELVEIAKSPQRKRYFGSERLVIFQYGKVAWNSNWKIFT